MDMEQTSKVLAAKPQSSAHVEWRKFEEQFMAEFRKTRLAPPQGIFAIELPSPQFRKPDPLAAMTCCASHPTQAAIKAAWVEPVSNAKPFLARLMRVKA